MNRLSRSVLVMFVGAVAIRLAWTGEFGDFLQQRMRWPLLIAGIAAFVLGVADAIRWDRATRADRDERRSRVAPGVGWLMIAPLLVLVAVAPTALGAAAVDRTDAYAGTGRSGFAPLPDGDPVPLTFLEFVDRAVFDGENGLADRRVRLTGFVVNDERTPDGYVLTRFAVACCAADALPVQVAVVTADPLPDDTWVRATVVWRAPAAPYDLDGDWIVEADLVEVEVLPEPPVAPYESPY